jgi:predicted TIM-barrel fold metal-dependent hydrolase
MWGDPEGDKLIRSMDEGGVDFTVICAVDNADSEIFTSELVEWQNKTVADVAQKHPDRVMALAGVDPRRNNATDLLKQAFEEFGMRGLKYHADYGYNPCGPESYRLLEIVQKNGGVLLTHTSPLPPPSRAKYADPSLLADIGVDFPELKVIAAHMGMADWRPWAALATHQPNLYGDLAMWDAYAFGRYELFCRELRDLIDFTGIEKVLFATDDPIAQVVRTTREWIALIKDLPANAPSGIRFTKEEVNAILGGNAVSLLGIG